ncbi:MAG: SDR family NAD(P)-dependent oxidoreductase [Pseudonocardiaceae bacterium]
MDTSLKDRVILVTGGSTGIGRAVALAYGAEGARVALTYHTDEPRAEKTAAAIREAGGTALTVPADLSESASLGQALQRVHDTWGGLDVLINNAVQWPRPGWPPDFAAEDPGQWRQTLRVNLEGVIDLTQRALPLLRAGGWGRIVFLSSGATEYGMPGEEAYAAAKSAVHGFARCLARDVGPQGILVNTVMPGLTTTEHSLAAVPEPIRQAVAQQSPTQRLSTPADVAAAVLFLGSGANGNITGEILRVSGGN